MRLYLLQIPRVVAKRPETGIIDIPTMFNIQFRKFPTSRGNSCQTRTCDFRNTAHLQIC
ncbi:hypothetical protein Hanom_Chr10g00919321 [Helianthus anomalus]